MYHGIFNWCRKTQFMYSFQIGCLFSSSVVCYSCIYYRLCHSRFLGLYYGKPCLIDDATASSGSWPRATSHASACTCVQHRTPATTASAVWLHLQSTSWQCLLMQSAQQVTILEALTSNSKRNITCILSTSKIQMEGDLSLTNDFSAYSIEFVYTCRHACSTGTTYSLM